MENMVFNESTIRTLMEYLKKNNELILTKKNECEKKGIKSTEWAQISLTEKYGISPEEAEQIVKSLSKGITSFEESLNATMKEDCSFSAIINKTTEGLDKEKEHDFFVNLLTAIELSGNESVTDEDLNTRRTANSTLSDPELLEKIEASIDKLLELEIIASYVKENVDSEILKKVTNAIELSNTDYRLIAALNLYCAQRDCKLNLSNSEIPLTPEAIGAMSVASTEALIATNKMVQGEITLTTWQRILKVILGTLVFLLFFAGNIILVSTLATGLSYAVLSILGTSIFAVLMSIVVVIPICYYLCKLVELFLEEGLPKLGDFYNKVIIAITNKVKNTLSRVKQWFSSTRTKDTSSETSNTKEEKTELPEAQMNPNTQQEVPDTNVSPAFA